MNGNLRSETGAATLGRGPDGAPSDHDSSPLAGTSTAELRHMLASVKGQAHFLLYLADQLEDALQQSEAPTDAGHRAFLSKVLSMYSSQLESKHHGLGDRITEVCQELYLMVRDIEVS